MGDIIEVKRLIGFIYNNIPENILYVVSLLIFTFYHKYNFVIILYLLSSLLFFCSLYKNIKGNEGFSYFSCNRSIFLRNHIWINQKVRKNRDIALCPKRDFVKEMVNVFNSIPTGTVCYCFTHELIKDHIISFIGSQVKSKYCYSKNLKRIKKQLRNDRCKKCLSKTCNLLVDEKTKFYAMKFIK